MKFLFSYCAAKVFVGHIACKYMLCMLYLLMLESGHTLLYVR